MAGGWLHRVLNGHVCAYLMVCSSSCCVQRFNVKPAVMPEWLLTAEFDKQQRPVCCCAVNVAIMMNNFQCLLHVFFISLV